MPPKMQPSRTRTVKTAAGRHLLTFGVAALAFPLVAACGGGSGSESESESAGEMSSRESGGQSSMMQSTMMEESMMMETTDALSGAEVGEDEVANMSPARGIKKEDSQGLPENPPAGIQVYPASTNELVRGEIDYEQSPATNGDHNPFWQNCGFYDEPVMEEKAVHSLDHGVVWITYQPDLAESEVATLRDTFGTEPYVIVSPYEDQDSPIVATSWRVQLPLDSASDERLPQFVDDFRVSELAPLSGNGCIGGSGEPVVSGDASYYEES